MKKLYCLISLIFLLTIAGCGGGGGGSSSTSSTVSTSSASSGTLSWTAPTTNADGSTPLDDLAGYKIYYGPSTGSYTEGNVEIDSGSTTSYDVESVCSGYCCFVVVAVDDIGNESEYSDEVCTSI